MRNLNLILPILFSVSFVFGSAPQEDRAQGAGLQVIGVITPVDVPHVLVKKEIASEQAGWKHHEISIRILDDTEAVFLARVYTLIVEEKYVGPLGFDEKSLAFEWLQPNELLHLLWFTCPQGEGTNTKQSHLLLQRQGVHWRQVFRDTQDFYGRDGPLIRYGFNYDSKRRALTIREENCSGPNSSIRDEPPEQGSMTVINRDVIYLTEWRFRLNGSTMEFLGGNKSVDLDERGFWLYKPEAETRTKREFSLASLARFLAPNDEAGMTERLGKLNHNLKGSDVCSGIVLIEDNVKWRGANEKHYYSMEE